MKHIVLCADDYGQTTAISQGILNLVQNQRLSATSCIVNEVDWSEQAQQLLAFRNKIDIGLHLNLTEGQPLSKSYQAKYGNQFFSLSSLLRRVFLGKLHQATIEAEIETQIEHFSKCLGFLPDYIDGHQHVHQFPIIRNALIKIYRKKCMEKSYVRLVKQKLFFKDILQNAKKIIIHNTGSNPFENILKQNHIPHNTSFSGIYSFKKAQQYKKLFPSFLNEIENKGVIMCHPALSNTTHIDKIADARYAEYQYFASDQFLSDCRVSQIKLEKF